MPRKKLDPTTTIITRNEHGDTPPPHRARRIAGGVSFQATDLVNPARRARVHDERKDPVIGAFLRQLEAE